MTHRAHPTGELCNTFGAMISIVKDIRFVSKTLVRVLGADGIEVNIEGNKERENAILSISMFSLHSTD